MQDDLDTIRDFFNQGGTIQALKNLAPDDLDQIYAYACQLFDAGDYAGAKRFYLLLSRLSHWQYDYWLALGLACQHLSEHEQAVFSFGQAALLRLDDPRPPFLAGLSHQLAGEHAHAGKAFAAALKWCADKPEHAAFKAQVARQAALSPEETPA